MNVGLRNALGRPAGILALLVTAGLLCGVVIQASPLSLWSLQRAPEGTPAVRFELPLEAEMQERGGLTVSGTFIGRGGNTPSWIARPSGEWIHVLLKDTGGKLLIDRQLWPYAPGRKPEVTPTVMYSRLGFPFEVLARCEALSPGRYSLEIRYDSPATNEVIAVSHTAVLKLKVRDASVPLRHLALEVPDRVVHDDFRVAAFGVSVRVVNDGCESQEVVPFAPEAVSVEARTSSGHVVPCQPAAVRATPASVVVPPMQSWGTFVPFSGRCDIPLPAGAGERSRYRMRVSYQGPGWTRAPLRLERTVDLELANLPHSSPR